MLKYLKNFESHTDYISFTQTEAFVKPNVSLCAQENELHYNPWTYADAYLTFVPKTNSTFQLSTNAVSYSLDNGETWTSLAAATSTPTVSAGSKIMWKGELTTSSNNGIGTFSSTGQFDVEGNVMSLLFGDSFKGQTDLTGKNYAFYKLFQNNTNLVSAEKLSLPATTLADYCYQSMFGGCTSLTTAPELPAITLTQGCYSNMFAVCTSLTTTPQLPATTLAIGCYNEMFSGCTGLTTVLQLPATTLANYCYDSMFAGCTSLTTAPQLPATTLANNCYYYMFSSCTGLTTAPQLPATTLAENCYGSMFSGCTSLTTAPELPATTLVKGCYQSMFGSCTSLNYIKAMFTTTPSNTYTYSWVNSVAASGTFVKNSAATWTTTGNNGIPSGWTVQTASA
jgi:hypothetical protein